MDQVQLLGIGLGLGVLVVLLLIVFIKSNMVLCQPNELVVIAGRRRKLGDGTVVGYRVMRGGRGFKWPLLESVARLPLTTTPVQVRLDNAMCKGMIPVTVEGRANVKLAGKEAEGMEAGIERFLGKGPDAITKTAQQAIEGALRGVIATVSPEEANANRLDLAKEAATSARQDLGGLGVVVDFLIITDVTDSHGYLEAIGRKRNAEVKRDARIAEATAEAEATRVRAEQTELGRSAEIAADTKITRLENEYAVHRSGLEEETNRARQRADKAGEIARVEEEIRVQEQRVKLAEVRENAETVIPAEARRRASLLLAEGESARILEDGRATAQAVELMREQWADEATRDLFLIQLLPTLLDKATSVLSDNLRIDKLTIVDGGDGQGVPGAVRNLTGGTAAILEELKNATGIDIARMARRAEGKGSTGAELPRDLDTR